ncbi:MAG: halocyanin domain-containing protein [Halobacteriaceae archaeon]
MYEHGTSRRAFLGAVAGAAGATTAGAGFAGRASGAETVDLSEWFSNTDNATRVVDKTGQDSVTVEVGAQGNKGPFAFGPAVVRIDPGTTVVWKWVNGRHNVVASDGSFKSPYHTGSGSYEQVFDSTGVTKYYCTPHKQMGMKGAIVVGDVDVSLSSGGGSTSTTTTSGGSGDGDGTEMGGAGEPLRTFGGWLEDVENYHGVVDKTGQDVVEVTVGAQGNGGRYAFEPPAIHVDSGTTVVWKWADEIETDHDVHALDNQFHSTSAVGGKYAVEFTGDGLAKYECETHSEKGMRGVVLVGGGPGESLTPLGWAGIIGTVGLTTVALGKSLQMHLNETTGPEPPESSGST